MSIKRFYIFSPTLGPLRVHLELVLGKHQGVELESAHIESLNGEPLELSDLSEEDRMAYCAGIQAKREEIEAYEALYRERA